jgi:hypothetical protein
MPLKRYNVNEASRFVSPNRAKRDASFTGLKKQSGTLRLLAHSVLRTMERNYVDLY